MPVAAVSAIGARTKWVTIEQLASADAGGSASFPVEQWTTLETVPVAKADVGGRELFRANQLSTPFDTRWEIAYREDMDPERVDVTKRRRLVYLDRRYDIVYAAQIGLRDGVELLTLSQGGG
jgi:SPP1 family predicted phage head-tail adaptor